MIKETIETIYGTLFLIIHGKNSVVVRGDQFSIRGIVYSINLSFEVKDGIITEIHRFITRTDDYRKEATYKQKDFISRICKTEVFNFLFNNPELLVEAEKLFIKDKARRMMADRNKIREELMEKSTQIFEFFEENKELLGSPVNWKE